MTGGTGSYSYMAPEIFRHLPYNAKADVYSLAMVMYEMLSGRRPFLKLDPKEAAFLAARDGLRPKWKSPPKDYSSADRAALPEVQAFVERCWSPSPASRYAPPPPNPLFRPAMLYNVQIRALAS